MMLNTISSNIILYHRFPLKTIIVHDRNSCRAKIKENMEHLSHFLQLLHPENKVKFRKLEKLNYKIIETKYSIHFNKNIIDMTKL